MAMGFGLAAKQHEINLLAKVDSQITNKPRQSGPCHCNWLQARCAYALMQFGRKLVQSLQCRSKVRPARPSDLQELIARADEFAGKPH